MGFWFGAWIEAVVSVDQRVGLIVRGSSSTGFHSFNRIWVRVVVVGGSVLGWFVACFVVWFFICGLVCDLLVGLVTVIVPGFVACFRRGG